MKTARKLPNGFQEYEAPSTPDSIWSVLADALLAARKVGEKTVTVEDTYRGCRTRITLPVHQVKAVATLR